MQFDPAAYGPEVAAILALDGSGERLLPLTQGPCSSAEARRRLETATAAGLFPRAAFPEAALAGLWLYFGCWTEAHETTQDLAGREGSYWHAIVHRQEPDAGNAGYWFRQAGPHPIFPALGAEAAAIGIDCGQRWDPFAFLEYCERARAAPGSNLERNAVAVQRAEWQLLFDFCAVSTGRQLR